MKQIITALALVIVMVTQAWGYGMPKREFRSAWIATVWCLDWPTQGAGATRQK